MSLSQTSGALNISEPILCLFSTIGSYTFSNKFPLSNSFKRVAKLKSAIIKKKEALTTLKTVKDDFNSVVKEESEKRGLRYFDITAISRRALLDRTLIASDGLHPSGKMYKLWVDKMIPIISKVNFD